MSIAYTLFDTALGSCGIAWTPRGVSRLALPEQDAAATTRSLLRSLGGPPATRPPPFVARAIAVLRRHLAGSPQDFSGLRIDLSGFPEFQLRVYRALQSVPAGATVSYGTLAAMADAPGAARAVGTALSKNPLPLLIPCHRVVAARGRLGGYSGFGALSTKERLLAIEGVRMRRPGGSAGRVGGRLEFDWDEAVEHLRAADPTLAGVIARSRPVRLEPRPLVTILDALAEAIVYQQLSGKVAATIFGRVKAALARRGRIPAEAILAATDEALRATGLSRAKAAALRDLATRTQGGLLPSRHELPGMSDAEIVAALTQVRGVGPWTVEMLLMFRLGRPDVLPVHDYGVRKGFSVAYRRRQLPTPRQLAAFGARWRPYRSVASWYLWRALEPAAAP